jgi:hypothetical protein
METKVIVANQSAVEVIRLIKGAIAKTPTGVSFFSVRYYENKEGEVSHYSINMGAKYANAVAKDIEFLKEFDPTTRSWKSSMIDIVKAQSELLNAFVNPNKTRSQAQTDAYEQIIGNALKVHKETGAVYVYGYLKSKRVLIPTEYEKTDSAALTVAKNEIRKLLKTSKFRMFKLDQLAELRTNGKSLLVEYPAKAAVI